MDELFQHGSRRREASGGVEFKKADEKKTQPRINMECGACSQGGSPSASQRGMGLQPQDSRCDGQQRTSEGWKQKHVVKACC